MINLLDAIKDLENKRKEIREETEKKIEALNQAIETLRITNEACWFCRGEGIIIKQGSSERIPCTSCNGTGIKHWVDDSGHRRNAANPNY